MKRISLLLLGLLLLGPAHAVGQETRLLIVGDSWAEQMWDDGSHELVFGQNDLGNVLVDGSTTTDSGSTAADWKQAAYLQLVADALAAQPSIDTVQLTVGGNDFLNTWNTDFTEAELKLLKNAILFDLHIIVDYILKQDPELEIILSFYDYPNFVDTVGGILGIVCNNLHTSLGQPSPQQINEIALEFESLYAELANKNPRIHFVSHFGLMQFSFGFPDDGIPPGSLTPPGDIALPSPEAAMRQHLGGLVSDCFHLRASGYDILIQNLVDAYYAQRFGEGTAEALVSLEGLVQTYDGSPRPVEAITDPAGLKLVVTYDGNLVAPTDTGNYTVLAMVDQEGWTGQAEGTLTIEQAAQTLSFGPLPDLPANAGAVILEASINSPLPVTYQVLSGPASVNGVVLNLTGEPGLVTIEASQAGDGNWLPAKSVESGFEVLEVLDGVFQDRFESPETTPPRSGTLLP